MVLRIKTDRWGQFVIVGQTAAFMKYERDIISGKIPCPYKATFRDSRWESWLGWGGQLCDKRLSVGKVVHRGPLPLTPDGKSKIHLF